MNAVGAAVRSNSIQIDLPITRITCRSKLIKTLSYNSNYSGYMYSSWLVWQWSNSFQQIENSLGKFIFMFIYWQLAIDIFFN